VKQSGGYVWIESEEGRGSTFKVFLPSTDEAEAPSCKGASAASSQVRGSETILLVDDEDSVRSLLARVLRKNGYAVLEAHDGTEAVGIAERPGSRIDLAITDVVMPRMGGRALAERLKALRSGMPVLFISGFPDEVVPNQGEAGAGTLVMAKPIICDLLLKMIRQALDSPAQA
jgi:CheY-like chemotaxis protein